MSIRQRMRINSPSMKVTWKTWAVVGADPVVFAEKLAAALQELTDEGYHLVSQMPRDGAIIITGQKTEGPFSETEAHHLGLAPTIPPPRAFSNRRRLVVPELPEESEITLRASSTEVLYHYLENGEQHQERFDEMEDVVPVLRKHLTGEKDILPISCVTVLRFEPDVFPALLAAFPDDKTLE